MGAMGWGTRPKNFTAGETYPPNSYSLLENLRQQMSPKTYTPEVDEELVSFTAWFTGGDSAPCQFAVYEITGGVDSCSLLYEHTFSAVEESDYFAGTTEEIPYSERITLKAGNTYAVAIKCESGSFDTYGFYTESGWWESVTTGLNPWADPFVVVDGQLIEYCGLANTRIKRATRIDVKQNYTVP